MIARAEWLDLGDAWALIARETGSSYTDHLEAVCAEAIAAGVRTRPAAHPIDGLDDPDFHADDLRRFLKRPRGRPEGTRLDASGDRALALLARALRPLYASEAKAIEAAVLQFRAEGLHVAGQSDDATVKRIRNEIKKLSE